MRKIDSKDMWYFAMVSVLLSFVTPNFMGSFALFLSSLICGLFYFIHREKERNAERRKEDLEQLKNLSYAAFHLRNILENVKGMLEEKPKTSRRKTTSRRIKRK